VQVFPRNHIQKRLLLLHTAGLSDIRNQVETSPMPGHGL
jgi:hypothetical protein